MRISFQYVFIASLFFIACPFFFSCNKVNVNFGNYSQTSDPNVSYYENAQISLQTLQIDSFLTSSASANKFMVGFINDPELGTTHAGSYVELQLPATNPILNQNVTFDSLVLLLKPQGTYYGDTTHPFTFKIYQLAEQIQNLILLNNNYYNSTSFAYGPNPIGGQTFTIYPTNKDSLGIRMSASLGQDLLNKFQSGAQEILNQTSFLNYFNGIYIDADTTSTNTIYNFNASANNLIMRLYYNLNGLSVVPKYVDFSIIPTKQFNHIAYNRTGTALASFPPFINNHALLSSTLTGNKAYLNSSTGTYIKISFPDLQKFKLYYPYVQVLSAQLVIKPAPGTYNYPYILPPSLTLYQSDVNNDVLGPVTSITSSPENGSLFIDNINGQTTQYTYDVTNFITSQLNPPTTLTPGFPNALILSPGPTLGDETLSRLVINDQNSATGILLKLYVLGI